MTERIDAKVLVRLMQGSLDALGRHREEINALNVFPVPDGDTGTNMYLTMQAVMEEVKRAGDSSMAAVCDAVARGSLMGARGNSGVVLSQVLKGFTQVLKDHDTVGVRELSLALKRGSEVAYRAVMKPVEGTILTVVREASEGGEEAAGETSELETWLAAVARRARESLDRTPELLPVLKEAGVVDAGGMGFVVILEGMLSALSGKDLEAVEEELAGGEVLPEPPGVTSTEDFRYELQFLLQCDDEDVEAFRRELALIGGSVLVVGGDGLYRVHLHTDRLGEAVELASARGRMRDVEITDLREQVESLRSEEAERESPGSVHSWQGQPGGVGVVAVSSGEGLREIFLSLGAGAVVEGGQSMNPSTAELLQAVDSLPQEQVIVLPNNKNIIPAAEQMKGLTRKEVMVIPTRSVMEGLTALVAMDGRASLAENGERMSRAASGVRTGFLTHAVRDSRWSGGEVRKGYFIGLFRDGIVSHDEDLFRAAVGLLEAMLEEEDGELLTMILGEGFPEGMEERLRQKAEQKGLEVEVIRGGQPLYPLILGLE
ncbi:MAG: DAK2 domain-containing protein [Candidatus Geothermincolales bacterium]